MDFILEFFKSIDWSTISANAIIFGLIIWAVIKYFSKSFINSLGDETAKLVTAKQKTQIEESVKQGFNEALEKYKSDLNKEEIDYKIRLETFYSKQFEVINKIYHLITIFYIDASMVADPQIGTIEERSFIFNKIGSKSFNSYQEFKDYFIANKLFLEKQLAQNIDTFTKTIADKLFEYGKIINLYGKAPIPTENLINISKFIQEKKQELDIIEDKLWELIKAPTVSTHHFSTDKDETKETQS